MKKITRKNLDKHLARYATDEPVLDVGAGRVSTNHSYQNLFPNRYTVDVDPKRDPDLIADIHKLPLKENSYNFILCTEVLEHCHTPQQAISELKRVLKPGGTLVLTTRFVYPLHDVPQDYYRFTKYGLNFLFKDWNIVELTPETKTFSAIAALIQRLGFQTVLRGGKITKAFVYATSALFDRLNWMIKSEYGDIKREKKDDYIMTTGYFLVVKN